VTGRAGDPNPMEKPVAPASPPVSVSSFGFGLHDGIEAGVTEILYDCPVDLRRGSSSIAVFGVFRAAVVLADCGYLSRQRSDGEQVVSKSILCGAISLLALVTFSSGTAVAAVLIADDEAQAPNAKLITDKEARRPTAPPAEDRGITRAPTITLETPVKPVVAHKPFELKIELKAHGGATIDPAKIHVTYLKEPSIDLTQRLRPFVTADGIDMPDAEAPAGDHPLRIDVEDSDGRDSHTIITLAVGRQPS